MIPRGCLTLLRIPDRTGVRGPSSGPQVFLGYWNDPELTARSFFERDGRRFFHTGDLGRIDEDCDFLLVDRLKRMINASGFKVWPAEVEAALHGHPDIREACVIGTLDARRGETVKAVVVLKAGREGQARAMPTRRRRDGRFEAALRGPQYAIA
jgi:acyl-CoA synthetase (AMP-forming)/AMP-acid ligase II